MQAPTDTYAASAAGEGQAIALGGTSGATPYAGGAAALLFSWLRTLDPPVTDPGQVYALLILAGDRTAPFNYETGAGRLRLPTDGQWWWGKVTIDESKPVAINLPVRSETLGGHAGRVGCRHLVAGERVPV